MTRAQTPPPRHAAAQTNARGRKTRQNFCTDPQSDSRTQEFPQVVRRQSASSHTGARTASHRGRRVLLLILIIVVLLVFVGFIYLRFYNHTGSSQVAQAPISDAPLVQTPTSTPEAATNPAYAPYDKFYYYDSTRADRYIAYAKKHPKLEPADVVWQVDVDLDYDVFTHVEKVQDPDSDTALVNKHFKLDKDFVPKDLVSLDSAKVRAPVAAAFKTMASAANAAGYSMTATSGYRSYAYQEGVFDRNAAKYGKANAYIAVAVPGFSEHQSGLAIDVDGLLRGAQNSETSGPGGWLHQNAWKYGFIVRYTKANRSITQYVYEPWHVRYVGKAAAKTMHDQNIATFEEYWVKYVKYQPPVVY